MIEDQSRGLGYNRGLQSFQPRNLLQNNVEVQQLGHMYTHLTEIRTSADIKQGGDRDSSRCLTKGANLMVSRVLVFSSMPLELVTERKNKIKKYASSKDTPPLLEKTPNLHITYVCIYRHRQKKELSKRYDPLAPTHTHTHRHTHRHTHMKS